MGSAVKNLAIILGLVTVSFAGYYLYSTTFSTSGDLSSVASEQTMADINAQTAAFIGYRQKLDTIKFNTQFFEDPKFNSLRSFRTPLQERPVGRIDPFADTLINSEGL